jgi:hypothetical protein
MQILTNMAEDNSKMNNNILELLFICIIYICTIVVPNYVGSPNYVEKELDSNLSVPE